MLLFIAVSSVTTAGCELIGVRKDSVSIQTDKHSYNIERSSIIELTVTNRSGRTLYYICTGQIYLEEIEDGSVVSSWLVHGFEKCRRPVPIEPGSHARFEIELALNQDPMPFLEEARFAEGVVYRFRIDLYQDKQLQDKLRASDCISNRVWITR